MASTNPVPSRAAINALRGVIFTTSCSVILLAEERRRRIQIARAAIDNARKLHTVRVNHGPALSESFGRREAWGAELAEDLLPLSVHSDSQGPLRRRRPNKQLSKASDVSQALEPKRTARDSRDTASTAETRQQEWDEWDAARRELSRVSASSPFAHHDLFLRVAADDEIPIPPLTRQEQESNEQRFKITTKVGIGAEDLSAEPSSRPIQEPLKPSASVKKEVAGETDTMGALRTAFFGEAVVQEMAESAAKAEEEVAEAEEEAALKKSWKTMNGLLPRLRSHPVSPELIADLDRATELLGTLYPSSYLEPGEAIARGFALLKCAVRLQQYDKIPAVLDATLPACTNGLQFLLPFIEILEQNGDVEGIRQLLYHSSKSPKSGKLDQYDMKSSNSWVIGILNHKWRGKKSLDPVMSLYALLQEAGLFSDRVPITSQYAVRRRIILIALTCNNEELAQAELQALKSLDSGAVEVDSQLKARFISQDARLGRWDNVSVEIEELKKINGLNDDIYQTLLSKLSSIYTKTHSPQETDAFVRNLVDEFGMALNRPVSFLVMERHGRKRDIGSLVQWIKFCKSSGLEMDQHFFNKVAQNCCKYWNFDQQGVASLFKSLETFTPGLKQPQLSAYSHNGALGAAHKRGSEPEPRDVTELPTLPQVVGQSILRFEQQTFNCLNSRALQGKWNQVALTYKEASAKGLGSSSRCLRLAVIAHLKRQGGRSEAAARLVREAHEQGHDVSGALIPLLVAQVESGVNAEGLINATLNKGARIHDSVYNKATRILADKGSHDAAITICKVAAMENGRGDLSYNQFNFSNLVTSCTKSRSYDELAVVVSSFTSKSVYWQGSKQCKESIKLAMKIVALWAEEYPDDRERHESALLLLDRAFQHVKDCRATIRSDRQALAEELVDLFKPAPPAATLEEILAYGRRDMSAKKGEAKVAQVERRPAMKEERRPVAKEKETLPRIESQEEPKLFSAYG